MFDQIYNNRRFYLQAFTLDFAMENLSIRTFDSISFKILASYADCEEV